MQKNMPTVTRLWGELLANAKREQFFYCSEDETRMKSTLGRIILFRWLRTKGFGFHKRKSHYGHQCERQDIALIRLHYLQWTKKYREEGWVVFVPGRNIGFQVHGPVEIWGVGVRR